MICSGITAVFFQQMGGGKKSMKVMKMWNNYKLSMKTDQTNNLSRKSSLLKKQRCVGRCKQNVCHLATWKKILLLFWHQWGGVCQIKHELKLPVLICGRRDKGLSTINRLMFSAVAEMMNVCSSPAAALTPKREERNENPHERGHPPLGNYWW